ncbi:15960_t:CDS:2 [Racocetra fulgida]|uniref:15960_t:CDS:1 n=1 Tax=Racocetra fulgida TaxID=60492 RepID=A0A9N8VZ16_9GLOM|nr:15960_t:CDS:2 [Racocetra fulgida]
MASPIDSFFVKIEKLIEFQLVNGQTQEQKIKLKFAEGKALIDKLEEEDEEQHGYYKYRYYSTYASYLKVINKIDKAAKQEKLLEKYKKFGPERENIDKNESLLFVNAESDNQSSASGKNPLEESIREKLIKAQDILDETVIEPIKKAFEILHEAPKTFEDYQKIVNYVNTLLESLNVLIDEELVVLDQLNNEDNVQSNQSEIKQKIEKVLGRLIVLKDLKNSANNLTNQMVYSKADKKAVLFNNILFTEGGINKRYRELASCFHPDRTKYFNAPNGLHGNDQYLGAKLFRIILEIKEDLLRDLEKASESKGVLNFHEKNANEYFNIANDYRNTYKNNGNKLKILNKEEISEIPNTELRHLSISYELLAYREYRASCKVADATKELKKQIKLRESIALCLYIFDHLLEAQLYALLAIQLICWHSQYVSQKELVDAKKVFDKVRGEISQLNTDIKLKDDLSNSQALVKVMNEGISFLEKCNIQHSVDNDLRMISAELMFKPDRRIVSYQASQENILYSKVQYAMYKIAGALSLIGATATVALGKQGTMLLDEPKIREKLNEIIKVALDAYDKGNYQQFFDSLCKEYKKNTSLIKIKESNIIIPEDIIGSLLRHGFRSDGIAYLLNLIGEMLSSNKIKTPDNDRASDELRTMGKIAFKGVLYKKLVEKAKALDDQVHTLREDTLKSMAKSTWHKIIDFLLLKSYSELAKEYKDNAREMPFQSRLKEMRNIARLNLVIFDIINSDEEAPMRINKTVEEIRNSISYNYQFSSSTESCLEALEDFLWIMRGDVSKSLLIYSIEPAKKQCNEEHDRKYDQKYMEYLKDKLQKASNNNKRIDLHSKLADYFVKLAEEDKVDLLSSLRHWHNAKEHYSEIRVINPKINYDKAMEFIIEALKLNPQNILITKQKRHLDRIKEHCVENRVNRHNKKIYSVDNSLKNLHRYNEDDSVYKILSIDGGGVRSILPALWLSELEYHTHKPISQLFNMVVGTSTGGFIAAGLSMPREELSTLTNLVIPAVKVNKDYMQSYLFTCHNSTNTLFDALMATTAAPTFFPSYKIKDKGIFVDGGVKLNNPALTAYTEVFENRDIRKITVLSLGTGSYIPDPLRPDLYHCQLFWEKNLYNDECNVDNSMYSMLGNCYQRWQVLLDKPVSLDDCNNISYLLELGHQYIEELDASDENPLNVLVESFESG